MNYILNKAEIIEEAFKFEPGEKARKFARRGVKAINNVPYDTFKKQSATVLGAPIAGTVVGGAIGNSIHGSEGEDDEYDVTGALLGAGAGLVGSNKMLTKMVTPGDTNRIKTRLKRDGVLLRDDESKTLNTASRVARNVIFNKNMSNLQAEGQARQAQRKG